jgi:hypothetical protein
MHLVQILLPLNRNDGTRQPASLFEDLRSDLVSRFGGLTAYARSPAIGLWDDGGKQTAADDVVIFEVMTDELDRTWWATLRRLLEARFQQDAIIVRALPLEPL